MGAGVVTYAELARRAASFAAGLGPGRKLIAIEAALSSHAIAAYLGALRGGHAVILLPADDEGVRLAIQDRFHPDLCYRRVDGRWRLLDAAAPGSEPLHPALALVLLTSGSTGQGKAVRLSGKALAANAGAIAQFLELSADDRGLLHLPLHYSYGLSVLNSHLAVGASLYVTKASILDPGFLAALRDQRCTSFPGVPHSYELLEFGGFSPQVLSGSPLHDRRRRTHARAHGPPLSRPSCRYRQAPVRDVRTDGSDGAHCLRAPGTARPASGSDRHRHPSGELGLVDESGQAISAADTVGELVYRGPNVMMGYAEGRADLGRGPELDRAADGRSCRTGWVGALSHRRPPATDVEDRWGRIGHDALEAALARCGIEAAIVGDDRRLVAFHPALHTTAEVRQQLAAASGLTWRHVDARSLASLPRLATGKIDYQSLTHQLDAVPAAPADGVLGDFQQTFFPQPVHERDSFVALGGDSLRYLELSMDLERRLGSLPPGWEHQSVRELSALKPQDFPAGRIATDIVIRVLAIFMILVHHATSWPLPAGSTTLIVLVGFSMARFQRRSLIEQDYRRFFRPLVGVLGLYYLLVAGYAVAWGTIPWASVLLVGNLGLTTPEAHLMLPYSSWFVEVFVQILLIWAGLFLIPSVRRMAGTAPLNLAWSSWRARSWCASWAPRSGRSTGR